MFLQFETNLAENIQVKMMHIATVNCSLIICIMYILNNLYLSKEDQILGMWFGLITAWYLNYTVIQKRRARKKQSMLFDLFNAFD